jgi:hypothetical protein
MMPSSGPAIPALLGDDGAEAIPLGTPPVLPTLGIRRDVRDWTRRELPAVLAKFARMRHSGG